MIKLKIGIAMLLASSVTVVLGAPGPMTVYEITEITRTDLGTLGGDESVAKDINDKGEIVGWAKTPEGYTHAFLHRNGSKQDLGVNLGFLENMAYGINNNTEIVGTFTDGDGFRHAVIFGLDGLVTDLPEVFGYPDFVKYCGFESYAVAINGIGEIVGSLGSGLDKDPSDTVSCGLYHAYRWSIGSPTPLALIPGEVPPSRANDINDDGQVVGYDISFLSFDFETFRWTNGVLEHIPRPAGFGATHEDALGINDAGHVVGRYTAPDNNRHAIFWNGNSTKSVDLGTLPGGKKSVAYEVNNQRFVAGTADRPRTILSNTPLVDAAFLWHADFGMRALPAPPVSINGIPIGFSSCEAYAVNDTKLKFSRDGFRLVQVVGYCRVNGNRHAMRWDVTLAKW